MGTKTNCRISDTNKAWKIAPANVGQRDRGRCSALVDIGEHIVELIDLTLLSIGGRCRDNARGDGFRAQADEQVHYLARRDDTRTLAVTEQSVGVHVGNKVEATRQGGGDQGQLAERVPGPPTSPG